MTLTYAQRLALDHRERTNGYDDDLSLAEIFEARDEEFRHWDQFVFQAVRDPEGRSGDCGPGQPITGTSRGSADGRTLGGGAATPRMTDNTFARAADKPLGQARERGATASSDDDGGAPTTCPPGDMESPAHAPAPDLVGSEAGAGSPTPSGNRPGLATSSWQHWLWTA